MIKGTSRGRGMLQLETWKPCRRPGQPRDHSSREVVGAPVPPAKNGNNPVNLVAKYNYKANLDRPGGFDEMVLTPGERLEFIAPHPINPYWWEAKKMSGDIGFVPATYVMILEDKPTTLPWLDDMKAAKEKRKEEMEKNESSRVFGKQPPGTFKPYVSAYAKTTESSAQSAARYYCKVCDKTLNGPKPYQAHMVSRAHKDEVEAASFNS